MSFVSVAGLRAGAREWTSTAGPGIVAVPNLDGVLSTHDDDLAGASTDFGNRVRRRPLAVLRPRTAADVAAIVRFGRECGVPVVARGSGHSVEGQAQVRDGIVVDMGSLAEIHDSGPDRISADAGARWSAVVAATLPKGLAPPVLPDYLELSVGGTLSVGGVGGASHRYGSQADNVLDLDVVTPLGELLTCSPTRDAALFDAVRATQGRYGIITRATMALAPAQRTARRHLLSYHDLGAFLADQRRLIGDRRFDHVLGHARPGPTGWTYVLEVVSTYTPPRRPDDRALLADLAHERGSEESETSGYGDFLGRLAPFEARLRAVGAWQHHPHPRCNVLLPGRHAQAVIAGELGGTGPGDIGDGGSVLINAIPTARLQAPYMPNVNDPVTVLFGMQRTAPPGDTGVLERMLRANAALRASAVILGGADYAGATAHHDSRSGAAHTC
ncbi:FAD-binding protein [Dactylosporangium sp. NPDC051484]|uniref:FAD-binding protein n=1 Tax=Dactylosporangium sp. NPDC051484 TaxID=3154942 RepID=UPI00344DE13E